MLQPHLVRPLDRFDVRGLFFLLFQLHGDLPTRQWRPLSPPTGCVPCRRLPSLRTPTTHLLGWHRNSSLLFLFHLVAAHKTSAGHGVRGRDARDHVSLAHSFEFGVQHAFCDVDCWLRRLLKNHILNFSCGGYGYRGLNFTVLTSRRSVHPTGVILARFGGCAPQASCCWKWTSREESFSRCAHGPSRAGP